MYLSWKSIEKAQTFTVFYQERDDMSWKGVNVDYKVEPNNHFSMLIPDINPDSIINFRIKGVFFHKSPQRGLQNYRA